MADHYKRYTDEQRATLCVMLEAQDYPNTKGALANVSKYSRVPESTLRGWFKARSNPPPAKLREEKREALDNILEDIAYAMLDHAGDADTIAEMRGRDAVFAAAIAIDKMRLLREQSTGKITIDITNEIEGASDEFERIVNNRIANRQKTAIDGGTNN